jgi:CDP-diacylglycerol--glycerol-3-phosphate 3-phosphatidyltransferase
MMNLSNSISLLRAPLAFLFLFTSPLARGVAVFVAMISDFFDGYLARKRNQVSYLGAILDPLMDKFFVIFSLGVLYFEGKVSIWGVLAMLSRDMSLLAFLLVILGFQKWRGFVIQALKWGKITTALQFLVLILLTMDIEVPSIAFSCFVVLGFLAFIELCQMVFLPSHRQV